MRSRKEDSETLKLSVHSCVIYPLNLASGGHGAVVDSDHYPTPTTLARSEIDSGVVATPETPSLLYLWALHHVGGNPEYTAQRPVQLPQVCNCGTQVSRCLSPRELQSVYDRDDMAEVSYQGELFQVT